jgi:SAM-dependent methyltransferase
MSATCPACLSPDSRAAMEVAGHPLRRCRSCSSLWVAEPPPPEATESLYREESYYTADPTGETSGDGIPPGYTGHYLRDRHNVEAKFAQVLEHVERYAAPGRLLDVGCGPGFLLSVARDRGWSTRGVDMNAWAATYAREQLELEVTRDTLESAAFEDAAFDAVTMMDLIEHVADPGALGRRWPEVRRAGEHLVLLSLQGAVELLRRNGYSALGWHYVGKTSSLATLTEDIGLAAPTVARAAARVLERTGLARRELEFDPHTKFVLYARRAGDGTAVSEAAPVRLSKRA